MLLLRIGRRARWTSDRHPIDPSHVADAALDLELGPGEIGLSVFRVEDERDQTEVAARFALTCRDRPAHVDFVVFPDELATELGLVLEPAPMPELDGYLSQRHHEILGLTDELALRLSAVILACADRQIGRVRDRELAAFALEIDRRDPTFRGHMKGGWMARLAPLLSERRPQQ